MLRYRYANASPKRQDWEDAHEWRKDGNHYTKLVKRRHHPVLASVKWADPSSTATLSADLYDEAKGHAFWKASIAAMVEADKEAGGKWAARPSVALPGDKFLAADRRRITAMVGTDAEWFAYTERIHKALRGVP